MSEPIRILFVDDDPNVLNGLRRAIANGAEDWHTEFCAEAKDALIRMDVIVTDMRMPSVDGAQLLEQVRVRHPSTIRIILSGYADPGTVLRTIGPAHAYLAKPCNSKEIADAIARPLELRRLMANDGMLRAVGQLVNLPSMPSLYLEIESLLRSPSASVKAVADIISQDIAMTAEVLKLTNSAFFSVGAKITTPLQAVRILGLETIQTLVLSTGIFRQFLDGGSAPPSMIRALTRHGTETARLAEAIALAEGADGTTGKAASCAGMLSCLGPLVLLDSQPDRYRALLARVDADHPLDQLEQGVFGADHALIGAYLLGLWGFSESMVEAVARSCRPRLIGPSENLLLTALHAARALSPPLPGLADGERDVPSLDEAYLDQCGRNGSVGRWQALASSSVPPE